MLIGSGTPRAITVRPSPLACDQPAGHVHDVLLPRTCQLDDVAVPGTRGQLEQQLGDLLDGDRLGEHVVQRGRVAVPARRAADEVAVLGR